MLTANANVIHLYSLAYVCVFSQRLYEITQLFPPLAGWIGVTLQQNSWMEVAS